MNLSWLVASIAVSPYWFFKKTPLYERSLLFSWTESFKLPKNRFITWTWFRVFCTCFLCWVCRLIKSERSGESPSLSARRLCKICTLNESFCKERDGLASLKNSFGKRLAKYIFFCLGIAKIVFQLNAVKFTIELILRIQNNAQCSVCTCYFGWVAWKSKRSGVSPSRSARELGFHWLWLASSFWAK